MNGPAANPLRGLGEWIKPQAEKANSAKLTSPSASKETRETEGRSFAEMMQQASSVPVPVPVPPTTPAFVFRLPVFPGHHAEQTERTVEQAAEQTDEQRSSSPELTPGNPRLPGLPAGRILTVSGKPLLVASSKSTVSVPRTPVQPGIATVPYENEQHLGEASTDHHVAGRADDAHDSRSAEHVQSDAAPEPSDNPTEALSLSHSEALVPLARSTTHKPEKPDKKGVETSEAQSSSDELPRALPQSGGAAHLNAQASVTPQTASKPAPKHSEGAPAPQRASHEPQTPVTSALPVQPTSTPVVSVPVPDRDAGSETSNFETSSFKTSSIETPTPEPAVREKTRPPAVRKVDSPLTLSTTLAEPPPVLPVSSVPAGPQVATIQTKRLQSQPAASKKPADKTIEKPLKPDSNPASDASLTSPIVASTPPQVDQPQASMVPPDARHQAILQQALQQPSTQSDAQADAKLPLDHVLDVRLQDKGQDKAQEKAAELPFGAGPIPATVASAATAPRFVLRTSSVKEVSTEMPMPGAVSQAPIQHAPIQQASMESVPPTPQPTTQANTYTQDAPRETTQTAPSQPALPPDRAEHTQPLRSFSLQFSPEGSKDVRLHVSQQSGDVHISVHSNDASLSNKLQDGVQDLVGHLSNAGYEADARTNPDGGRRQQQEREQESNQGRQNRKNDSRQFDQMISTDTEKI